MNPELAAILGRNLDPAPGSEPAPMGVVARLNPAFTANRTKQKRAMWTGATRARVKAKTQAPKPAPKPRGSPIVRMSREHLLAAYAEHGSWAAVATHHGVGLSTVTKWAKAAGAQIKPPLARAPIPREVLEQAYAEHGSWEAAARALKRSVRTVRRAAVAAGLLGERS
jgi:hypothetical protein